jgi:DNA-directed RNA polymerase subunit RPC12/RpoP
MDFVFLESFDNYIDAHIVFGRLEEEGIRCWLKDENTATVTPFFSNAIGGIKLMVDKQQLEQAKELLSQFLQEKKSKLACPYCGSHNIELVPSKKPLNLLGVIASWFGGSYAISAENIWHCYNCNKEFKEPNDTSNNNDEENALEI